MATAILPENLRGARQTISVNAIDWSDVRSREADLDGLADLADSIGRQGLQQPIGVKRNGERFDLIWGRRRLEVYRSYPDGHGFYIEAVVYPEDLPISWAKILELDENSNRQDLTPDQRAAHAVEWAAEIKNIESQGQSIKSDKSDFTAPTTGRGHKGIVQKVAERQGVDQAAVRKRAQKVAATIGEPVDLQADSPAELTRKAEKFRATPKPGRAKAEQTAKGLELMAVLVAVENAIKSGHSQDAVLSAVNWGLTGQQIQGTQWVLVPAQTDLEDAIAAKAEPALAQDFEDDPPPREKIQRLLDSGKWDLPQLTEHMRRLAPPGKVTLDNVTAFHNGKKGNYHVRAAADAVWSELRPYI